MAADVNQTVQEVNEILETVRTLAAEGEGLPEPTPLDASKFQVNDSESAREARQHLRNRRRELREVCKQLDRYKNPSTTVGPFPLDAIERVLSKHTSYRPSWVPSEIASTTSRLATDLERGLESLNTELQEAERELHRRD